MHPILIAGIILIVVPSIISHEAAHGFVADRLGDPTAREAGRLTLNPIPHIDLILRQCCEEAKQFLSQKRTLLETLAQRLLRQEKIDARDLLEILGPRPAAQA